MAKIKPSKPDYKRKAGDEGLPYTDASSVVGGPIEGQPEQGLQPNKGVKGSSNIKLPKGKK